MRTKDINCDGQDGERRQPCGEPFQEAEYKGRHAHEGGGVETRAEKKLTGVRGNHRRPRVKQTPKHHIAWCSESVTCGNPVYQNPIKHSGTAQLCCTAPTRL